MLKIICDENIPVFVTQKLVSLGYDAQHFASIHPWYDDYQLAWYCHTHQAILITQDKDFGIMVYFDKISILPQSILFCRVELFSEREVVLAYLIKIISSGQELKYKFLTITSKWVKIRSYKI